ncbi:MAG: folate-binding protein YgfZ [Planctomycetota bacterium]|jgi:folate-binding protein YgfZ
MQNSPLLQIHQERGARLAASPTGDVLLTYGNVPAEYKAATEAALVFDDTNRGRVHATGADATDFLHRLLANQVKRLDSGTPEAPGSGNFNLLLTGKGKIVEQFELAPDGSGGYLLFTEPGRSATLISALDMYLFADDVVLTDQSEQSACFTLIGPTSCAVLQAALGVAELTATGQFESELVPFAGHTLRLTHVLYVGCDGYRVEAGPETALALWDALLAAGAMPGGLAIHDILRVESCTGQFGRDIDDTIYPQEARLETSFNLDKGCYIGQEVVAKIDTYGGLNKRLMLLEVSHDDPIAPGTRLERYDEKRETWRDLGVATSWGYSFARDGGCILAYVKRRHQDLGTEFRLGEAAEGLVPGGEDSRPTATVIEVCLGTPDPIDS